MEKESILFTPGKIGPLTLRNRTIRAAAFESMCPGNAPSDMLYDYHKSVASGGIGMTTLAYAAVTQSGLSFERQLWMRPDIIPGLKHITDAIHKEGAAASVQLGHCGNMSHKNICGCRPISASSGFNIYSPTLVRGMKPSEITAMAKAFGQAVHLAREAGMDAVEIHAGHGYLISQFLSPYTNHRKDEYGGSLQNRMRFMKMCMDEVMKAAGQDMAVLVKMNMRDGFKGGMELDETLTSRETINTKMRSSLDEATDPWGIKVNRVELKNIAPPSDIQNSMEKQAKAERDKRAAILSAEGEKQSAILRAEGKKQSAILDAEAEKQAAILRAEAKKEAMLREAEGEAEAIRRVSQAKADGIAYIKEAKADAAVLQIKSMEAFEKAADGKATKIIVPSNLASIAGTLTALSETVQKDAPES